METQYLKKQLSDKIERSVSGHDGASIVIVIIERYSGTRRHLQGSGRRGSSTSAGRSSHS